MNIALIGFGGVGRGFVRLLKNKHEEYKKDGLELCLKYVLNSSGGVYNPKGINIDDFVSLSEGRSDLFNIKNGYSNINIDDILKNRDIDLLVELTNTQLKDGEPANTYIKKALLQGLHVVTGNKGPILHHYNELRELAIKNKVQLGIGCTTGGALPTINCGLFDMAGAEIKSIEGILNGTTNYILQEMEERELSYEIALEQARKYGIAEANPSFDVEGFDTAVKLVILANTIMKARIGLKDAHIKGITGLTIEDIKHAKSQNMRYKLIGKAFLQDEMVKVTVSPMKLPVDHLLYSVNGKNKGAVFSSDILGEIAVIGGASGVENAAAAILRDIVNIHRGCNLLV